MEHRDTTAPSGRPAGFAGLRVAAMVFALSALGGLAATAVATVLDRLDERASTQLRAELEARIDAGRTALAALEEAKTDAKSRAAASDRNASELARARAAELALTAALSLRDAARAAEVLRSEDPAARLGLVDLARDRILEFGELARGSTLSVALPQVATLAHSKRAPVRIAEDGGHVWALASPPFDENLAVVARVSIELAGASGTGDAALSRATSALVNLAAPADPIAPPKSSLPLFAAGALLGALLGALWAWFRIGRPVAATLARARAFVHGTNDARADDRRGGRDARDVAREVNALIERAERLKAQGRAARDEDVRAVVLAIEALGKGDLTRRGPEVGEALEPVATAIDVARRELLERITEIQHVAVEVATNAREVAPGAKKIGAAALEELDTLRELGNTAGAANEEVKAAGEQLAGAVIALGEFAQAERRIVQDVRTALRGSGRRVQELKRGASRLEGLIGTTEAIDEAMDLLAATADAQHTDAAAPSKSRISTSVGQARAAMEAIARELALLRDEMGETAASLDTLASSVPETAPQLESAVTGTLHDAATALVRVVELTTGALRSLERAARVMSEGATQIERGAAATAELGPRLGAVIAGFSLGNAFEKDLLEKIERWRREAEDAAKSPDGLTEDGRAIVRQVIEASEGARARLARLVSATEAAIDVLRA